MNCDSAAQLLSGARWETEAHLDPHATVRATGELRGDSSHESDKNTLRCRSLNRPCQGRIGSFGSRETGALDSVDHGPYGNPGRCGPGSAIHDRRAAYE